MPSKKRRAPLKQAIPVVNVLEIASEHLDPFSTAGPVSCRAGLHQLPFRHRFTLPSSVRDCQDIQRSLPSVLPLDAKPGRTMQLHFLPLSIPAYLDITAGGACI
jgi:hypothetical protein